jgi:hypothetical protein
MWNANMLLQQCEIFYKNLNFTYTSATTFVKFNYCCWQWWVLIASKLFKLPIIIDDNGFFK